MCKTDKFCTRNDSIGDLKARSAFFRIKVDGDIEDLKSKCFKLFVVNADLSNNRLFIGEYGSLSEAQKAADAFIKKYRTTPPVLVWRKA